MEIGPQSVHFKVGFMHFNHRTLRWGAILRDHFNHIWISKKIEVFAKNSEKGRYCSSHISMKTDSQIKIWGLEQTSQTGQQDGWEKR